MDTEINSDKNIKQLTEDPAHAFAAEMGLSLFDFCTEQLEKDIFDVSGSDLYLDELDVSSITNIDVSQHETYQDISLDG